jgi:hypothetical protein
MDLSQRLGIADGTTGTAIVLSVSSYSGRAPALLRGEWRLLFISGLPAHTRHLLPLLMNGAGYRSPLLVYYSNQNHPATI